MLIYGANGYTGRLVVAEAMRRGLPVVLGGRSEHVRRQAQSLGVNALRFEATPHAALEALHAMRDCPLVLNCAGPFSRTASGIVDACLQTGMHYLDITGEVDVFEAIAQRDTEARAAGIMLLPGVGFDVVPTDCLAVHLVQRLPTASRLLLAFRIAGSVSHGTLASMLENVGKAGLERRNGALVPVSAGERTLSVDFGAGPVTALQVSWGDLSTGYRSTGIGNIEVYGVPDPAWRGVLRASGTMGGALSNAVVQRLFRSLIRLLPEGPTAHARATGHSFAWGRVEDADGRSATSRLRAPEAYALTALTAVAAAERVLRGESTPGFQTPALAFGPEFVLGISGVTREDL